jgi:hypothetical protein
MLVLRDQGQCAALISHHRGRGGLRHTSRSGGTRSLRGRSNRGNKRARSSRPSRRSRHHHVRRSPRPSFGPPHHSISPDSSVSRVNTSIRSRGMRPRSGCLPVTASSVNKRAPVAIVLAGLPAAGHPMDRHLFTRTTNVALWQQQVLMLLCVFDGGSNRVHRQLSPLRRLCSISADVSKRYAYCCLAGYSLTERNCRFIGAGTPTGWRVLRRTTRRSA